MLYENDRNTTIAKRIKLEKFKMNIKHLILKCVSSFFGDMTINFV